MVNRRGARSERDPPPAGTRLRGVAIRRWVAHAWRVGWATSEALHEELQRGSGDQIYRIELGTLRPDPREALRAEELDAETAEDLRARLNRMDARAVTGAWTRRTLDMHLSPAATEDAIRSLDRRQSGIELAETCGDILDTRAADGSI